MKSCLQRIVTALGLIMVFATALHATIFIVPEYRTGDYDEDFAYWDGFDVPYTPGLPPYEGLTEWEVNHPFRGGNDRARLGQYRSSSAIITSNWGIYDYSGTPTAFYVYDQPLYSPGVILFQTMTYTGMNSTPDVDGIQLYYREHADDQWRLATLPLSGTVTGTDSVGNFYNAWEWDTSSLLIFDYYISFSYPEIHSSLSLAQLDTHETYVSSIEGYSLSISTNVHFGLSFGLITKTPDRLHYQPGEEVTVSVSLNSSFAFAKWTGDLGDIYTSTITVVMDSDVAIELILSPKTYYAWRQFAFMESHGGGTDMNQVWAPEIDYDLDGRTNLLEYVLGSDPEVSDVDVYGLRVEYVEDGGYTYLEATFTRRIGATDLEYDLEYSTDLRNWKSNNGSDGPFFSEPEVLGITSSGVEVIRTRLLSPISPASSPFVRVNANWIQ